MEPLPIDVPAIIDEILRRSLYSQRDLAKVAGVSQPALSAYQRGTRRPPLHVLQRLAGAGGLQLRLSLEDAGQDVVTDLAKFRQLPQERWLDGLDDWSVRFCAHLVTGIEHRFEGSVAARLQGVPVRAGPVEVAVIRTDESLQTLVGNARKHSLAVMPADGRYLTVPGRVDDLLEELDGDVAYWRQQNGDGHLRMRLATTLQPTLSVEHAGNVFRVAPLSELFLDDPRARRVLQVALHMRAE